MKRDVVVEGKSPIQTRFDRFLWPAWIVVGAVCACTAPPESIPESLRVTVLPDANGNFLAAQHGELLRYLESATGIALEMVPARDYDEAYALFRDGRADVAYLGGLTYVAARREVGAIPLACRDIDQRFTTTFIAPATETLTTLADFRGVPFAFGSDRSTSGHLMARNYLGTQGIDPEGFFSEIVYSGSHEATTKLVADGVVRLGAVSTPTFDQMLASGMFSAQEFKMVAVSNPYADYVWVARPEMSERAIASLQVAFFGLRPDDADHRSILASETAAGFIPVRASDWDELEAVAEGFGLLGPSAR